ncbi:MAG: 50S ribosomal protein L29 [Candidatus Marinimicrobia bacterium]|nr:50S ribosomal protein L29 [Candidatus Neomarinimicrobiota bacterium]
MILRKSELIKLGQEELITKLKDGQESLVNLRFQKALQQLEHPQRIRLVRREIAQIKTAIREFELGKRGN